MTTPNQSSMLPARSANRRPQVKAPGRAIFFLLVPFLSAPSPPSALELEAAVHRVLVAQTPAWCERELETPKQRSERLLKPAKALVRATERRDLLAAGITIAKAESALAAYVERDCEDKPKGCKGDCDRDRKGVVRARTYFQLQKGACPKLFELPSGSQEALDAAAVCAVKLWSFHRKRCAALARSPDEGAFAGYASLPCQATKFNYRAPLYRSIRSQLEKELYARR